MRALQGSHSQAPGTQPATPTVPPLNWNPCSPDGAVCAAAQVPLDYDDPAGPQTYVVLARYPVNPATKIGTVEFAIAATPEPVTKEVPTP